METAGYGQVTPEDDLGVDTGISRGSAGIWNI
jgi:hypothetical protein